MAMITDPEYILQAIRLSTLRLSDDSLTPRIISLDPSFALNPYINASGLSDVDRWPEIKRALDSPPLVPVDRPRRRPSDEKRDNNGGSAGGGGLQYTQTIMGGRSGALGMRVSGRAGGRGKKEGRANSSSAADPPSPIAEMPTKKGKLTSDGFFSPGRPRADSAPVPKVLEPPITGLSVITTGRGMGGGVESARVLSQTLSTSATSSGIPTDELSPVGGPDTEFLEDEGSTGIALSARPSELAINSDVAGPLTPTIVDEGSDVDDYEIEEEGDLEDDTREMPPNPISNRSSIYPDDDEELVFAPVVVQPRKSVAGPSALTALLNKHVPHLVSTSSIPDEAEQGASNPFASLYASVGAISNIPSISLELYFPHSKSPGQALIVKVRKDATVEEVTGYGLYKYWEDSREPLLSEEESEQRWSTVGWGLRIVEDDGEVDEDFPPLDRDSQISKFSYGQFAIVEATTAQAQQNAAKAPMIQRRPSRIIAPVIRTRPSAQGRPSFTAAQPPAPPTISSSVSSDGHLNPGLSSAIKGNVGLSSALSNTVLLRVRVTASADVHFTTTISVPSDMYIADLTEVLCKKKRLQNPASDWVLCLADLTLALPLDRTVASLEGRTDLALVRRQWAVEHGLRIDDRRGGDPSASIFKRISEPAPLAKFGAGVTDISQTYKKYNVQRKIAIGRHERVLAIDGDYIHIMPSESRAFFDSMKTTSFHISLVASCKLTGRAGGFKINVWRETGQKRYEFEADNGRQAAEIISSIRQLMRSYQAERTSKMPAPRPGSSARR